MPGLREGGALAPEAADGNHHLEPVVQDVIQGAGEGGVLQDGVDDDVVAVYFLEGDFPLAMTLLAVVGHLREEGGPVLEAQLAGVLNGFGKLVVAVHQQVPHNVARRGEQEEGHAAQFGVPIRVAAVFFARKSLGGNVEPRVVAPIGLVELEDVVADALLGFGVSLDGDVRFFPDLVPRLPVGFCQGFPAVGLGLSGQSDGRFHEVLPFVVERRGHDDIFHQGDGVARLDVGTQAEARLPPFLDADGVGVGFFPVLEELVGDGIAHL